MVLNVVADIGDEIYSTVLVTNMVFDLNRSPTSKSVTNIMEKHFFRFVLDMREAKKILKWQEPILKSLKERNIS